MRLNPALGQAARANSTDDVIPLSEPIRGTDGQLRSEVAVSKGTIIVVDIASSNRRKDVWGENADIFDPERWLVNNNAIPLVRTPGVVFGSVLNFLAGSKSSPLRLFVCLQSSCVLDRTCPGFVALIPSRLASTDDYSIRWRIAILELHTFICDLLLGFRIRSVAGISIEREFHGVSIPKVGFLLDTQVMSDCTTGLRQACQGRGSASAFGGIVAV